MHTNKCRNSIQAESLPIESVDYRSAISSIALVNIHLPSCKYGIKGFLSVILNDMLDLNAQKDRHIVRSAQ